MADRDSNNIALYLARGGKAKLVKMAERREFTITRGAGAGVLPSLSGFIDALAEGEYVAIRPEDGQWAELLAALRKAQATAGLTDGEQGQLTNLIAQIEAEAAEGTPREA